MPTGTVAQRARAEALSLHAQMIRQGRTVESVRDLIDDHGLLDRRDREEKMAWRFRAAVLKCFNAVVNGKEGRR